MPDITFEAFPKIHRLHGPVIVTEKIDGTNAQIIITETNEVVAASRTRLITPEKDNHGFARWVEKNKDILLRLLGPGRHYGEWWGSGIQRGYGLKEKRFSLFNTSRWSPENLQPIERETMDALGIAPVPTLFIGTFTQVLDTLPTIMDTLKDYGSQAAPGFMHAEGVVVYDTRSNQGFKRTFDYDETGKQAIRDEHMNAVAA